MMDQESDLEQEETQFRLRYGNVISGLCHMIDEYHMVQRKYPESATLVPILWHELLGLLNWHERYMYPIPPGRSFGSESILFFGIPVTRGTKCQALPVLPTEP